MAPPFKVIEFDILYGKGISRCGELVDLAVEQGIINKSASWFSYNGNKLGQGREAIKRLLETGELRNEIEARIKEKSSGGTALK